MHAPGYYLDPQERAALIIALPILSAPLMFVEWADLPGLRFPCVDSLDGLDACRVAVGEMIGRLPGADFCAYDCEGEQIGGT